MLKETKKSWVFSMETPVLFWGKEIIEITFSKRMYSKSDIEIIQNRGVLEFLEKECTPDYNWGKFFKLGVAV